MHTSWVTFCLFWGAVLIAVGGQIANYLSIPREQRAGLRTIALCLQLGACTARGFWDTGLNPTPPCGRVEAVSV